MITLPLCACVHRVIIDMFMITPCTHAHRVIRKRKKKKKEKENRKKKAKEKIKENKYVYRVKGSRLTNVFLGLLPFHFKPW